MPISDVKAIKSAVKKGDLKNLYYIIVAVTCDPAETCVLVEAVAACSI